MHARRRNRRTVRGIPAGFQFLGQNRRRPPQTRQRRPRRSRRIGSSLRNGRHRASYRRHLICCDLKLVGIGELRLPDPAATVATLDKLKELGFTEATKSGISIGISDMIIPKEKETELEQREEDLRTRSGSARIASSTSNSPNRLGRRGSDLEP